MSKLAHSNQETMNVIERAARAADERGERDEPFGRQPLPVTVTIEGDKRDADYWCGVLSSRAEFKGDAVQRLNTYQFTIFPRAVND